MRTFLSVKVQPLVFRPKEFAHPMSQHISFSQNLRPATQGKASDALGPCPICRSTIWIRTEDGNAMQCQYGHRSLEFRLETQGDESILDLMGGLRVMRNAGQSQLVQQLSQVEKRVEVDVTIPGVQEGQARGLNRDKFLTLSGIQIVLRDAIRRCVQYYQAKEPLETTCLALWTYYIRIVKISYGDEGTDGDEDALVGIDLESSEEEDELSREKNAQKKMRKGRSFRRTSMGYSGYLFFDAMLPSMAIVPVILQLTLRHHGYPVPLSEIQLLCSKDILPYCHYKLPTTLSKRMTHRQRRVFQQSYVADLDVMFKLQHGFLTRLTRLGLQITTDLHFERLLTRMICRLALPLRYHASVMRLFRGCSFPGSLGIAKRTCFDYRTGYIPGEHILAACLFWYTSIVLFFKGEVLVHTRHWTRLCTEFDAAAPGDAIDFTKYDQLLSWMDQKLPFKYYHLGLERHPTQRHAIADLLAEGNFSKKCPDLPQKERDYRTDPRFCPTRLHTHLTPYFEKVAIYEADNLPQTHIMLLCALGRMVGLEYRALYRLVERLFFEEGYRDGCIDRIIYRKPWTQK